MTTTADVLARAFPSTLTHPEMRADILARIAVVDDETSCWLWTGARSGTGYGRFSIGLGSRKRRRVFGAHRLCMELAIGPIAPDVHVLHSCDVKLCVRPSHLHPGTHADNMREAVERNRIAFPRGEAHPAHKLTESDVRDIIAASSSEPVASIARRYGVGYNCIGDIVLGKKWKHIERPGQARVWQRRPARLGGRRHGRVVSQPGA